MLRLSKTSLFVLSQLALLFGCGYKTDSGRNADKHPSTTNNVNSAEKPTGGKKNLSHCFAVVQKLPEQVQAFCDQIPADKKEYFAKVTNTFCQEKQYANFFQPQCGWTAGQSINKSYTYVDHTPINDSGTQFYSLTAYSVKIAKSKGSFKDIIMLSHSDSVKYKEKGYTFPMNTKITNIEHSQNGSVENLIYKMEVASSVGSTIFYGEMTGIKMPNGDEMVMEEILDSKSYPSKNFIDPQGITMRKSISFAINHEDGSANIVTFEEKSLPDRGLHDLAKKILKQMDQARMKLYDDNAKI